MPKIVCLKLFSTNLQRFPQDMSERAIREAKKPNFCSHDHSFSPTINPITFLEISAVPEYFSTTFICTLWKFKRSGFHDRQKGQMPRRKPWFFIFLNKRIKIVPNYSGTADMSKKETGLIIGEKLCLREQKFGFFSLTNHPFRHVLRKSRQICWK